MSSLFVLLCYASFSNFAFSSDQDWSVNISSNSASEFHHFWDECVGSGHGSLLLRKDWRKWMLNGHNHIGFKYVRAHGILDDDVGVVNGNGDYSFVNIDKIYEFLLSIDMKPYVEISFMPSKFASGNTTVCHYEGNTSPPYSYDVWYSFIRAWISHLVDHFGLEEILKWKFEVWNEPNIAFWPSGYNEYLLLYNSTAKAIKSVNSGIQVGGPTTAGESWLDTFIPYVLDNDIPIDFIVTHAYPNQGNYGVKLSNINYYYFVLDKAITAVNGYNIKYNRTAANGNALYFIISEWNSGCCTGAFGKYPNDDNHYAASFLVFMAKYLQPLFFKYDSMFKFMSYWAISDVFEEHGFQSPEFVNLYGLQTIHGIPKPAFRAMQLLNEFGSNISYNTILIGGNGLNETNDTVQVFCMENGNGNSNRYSVFVTNWNNYGYNVTNQSVNVFVSNLNGNAQLKSVEMYKIDENNTNPLQYWKEELGSPEYINSEQLDKLNQSSQLVALKDVNMMQINATTVQFPIVLTPYRVVVLDLQY